MISLIIAVMFAAFTATAPAIAESPYPTTKPDGTRRIQRTGTCPTGYVGVGNFCEALRKNAPDAMPKIKNAPCPSGYFASGDSCKALH